MRTRERLSTRLIAGHAQSRLERMSIPENPVIAIDAFRNMQTDVLAGGRTTGTGTNALDGYAVGNNVKFPLVRFPDNKLRMQCAYDTGVRLGYAFDGASPVVSNRLYQSRVMDTSGQTINWTASASTFYATGQQDPSWFNNGHPVSSEASIFVALAADQTLIQSATTTFQGSKLFSIWVRSYLDTDLPFDLQITSGTWVRFTATSNWKRFTVRANVGPALPGIRVPNTNDGVFLWGPLVQPSTSATNVAPHRQTVGTTPVTGGTADELKTRTFKTRVGTHVFDLILNPLENSADVCYVLIGNYSLAGVSLSTPRWKVDIATNPFLGSVTSFDESGIGDTVNFNAFTLPQKRAKLVIRVGSEIVCFLNGSRVAEVAFDTSIFDDNIYVQQSIHAHLVSAYRWDALFSDDRCEELSRL